MSRVRSSKEPDHHPKTLSKPRIRCFRATKPVSGRAGRNGGGAIGVSFVSARLIRRSRHRHGPSWILHGIHSTPSIGLRSRPQDCRSPVRILRLRVSTGNCRRRWRASTRGCPPILSALGTASVARSVLTRKSAVGVPDTVVDALYSSVRSRPDVESEEITNGWSVDHGSQRGSVHSRPGTLWLHGSGPMCRTPPVTIENPFHDRTSPG